MANKEREQYYSNELQKAEDIVSRIEILLGVMNDDTTWKAMPAKSEIPGWTIKQLDNLKSEYSMETMTLYLRPNAKEFDNKVLVAMYGEAGLESIKNGSVKIRVNGKPVKGRFGTLQKNNYAEIKVDGSVLPVPHAITLYEKNIEILTLRKPEKASQNKKEK